MKVELSYIDSTSLSPDDIRAQAKALFGDSARVTVLPDSDDVYAMLYFAVQEHVTMRQLHSYFDDGPLYQTKLVQLRKEFLDLVDEAFTSVIADNEEKLE